MNISHDNPLAVALVKAIHSGDLEALERLLRENPGLENARIANEKGECRTPLLVAADWPGHFPGVGSTIRDLIKAGADPNASLSGGRFAETPLHWAASSDDVDALDALLDGGAELEAAGASIAGGTALDDAVGYGQFNAARRLVARGARTKLWHASALGLLDRVEACFAGSPLPTATAINEAFWQACHGGQKASAEYLAMRGADLNWTPPWSQKMPLEIAQVTNPGRPPTDDLVVWLRSKGAGAAG